MIQTKPQDPVVGYSWHTVRPVDKDLSGRNGSGGRWGLLFARDLVNAATLWV